MVQDRPSRQRYRFRNHRSVSTAPRANASTTTRTGHGEALTLPKQRQRRYGARHRRRKAQYPDDETLIDWINWTDMATVARMLGVSKMALSYYVRSKGLEPRLLFWIRREYKRRKRARAKQLAQIVFDLQRLNDTHNE